MRGKSPQVVSVVMRSTPKAIKSNGEHIERLLCGECEHLIKSFYEDYGTQLFVRNKHIVENESHVVFTNFDFQKYVLFIVSILWRASVSSLDIYKSIQGLSELSKVFRPCLIGNTLFVGPPFNLRLDDFVKIAVLRIVDHTGTIPQSALDKVMYSLNVKRGDSIDEGLHFYFMADGFLVTASLFPPLSAHARCWQAKGRLLDRRFVKVPRVSFHAIQELYEGIAAVSSTENPFERPRPQF